MTIAGLEIFTKFFWIKGEEKPLFSVCFLGRSKIQQQSEKQKISREWG